MIEIITIPSKYIVSVSYTHLAGEFLVIDTGFNRQECREALWAGIRELKLDMSATVLFLTHYHEDHIGLVWDFVERCV